MKGVDRARHWPIQYHMYFLGVHSDTVRTNDMAEVADGRLPKETLQSLEESIC